MSKRQWFLVAGTLVLAACGGPGTGVCEVLRVSQGPTENRDENGYVECYEPQPGQRAEAPAPKVDS